MAWRSNESIRRGLVGPASDTAAHAIRTRGLFEIGNIKKFAGEIQLEPFKRRIESARQPADGVPGNHRARCGRKVANCVELGHIVPIRVGVLFPARLAAARRCARSSGDINSCAKRCGL